MIISEPKLKIQNGIEVTLTAEDEEWCQSQAAVRSVKATPDNPQGAKGYVPEKDIPGMESNTPDENYAPSLIGVRAELAVAIALKGKIDRRFYPFGSPYPDVTLLPSGLRVEVKHRASGELTFKHEGMIDRLDRTDIVIMVMPGRNKSLILAKWTIAPMVRMFYRSVKDKNSRDVTLPSHFMFPMKTLWEDWRYQLYDMRLDVREGVNLMWLPQKHSPQEMSVQTTSAHA